MKKLLVITKTFPPSVGGSHTVMRNLFRFINPEDYIILRDGMGVGGDKEFDYLGQDVNYPSCLACFRKIYPLDIFLIPIIVHKLLKIKRKYGIEKCLIVYPDPFFVVAGYIFARMVGIEYFLYFHDIWTEDEIRITDIVKKMLGKIFEKGIIKNSAAFFVLTTAMREFYQKKHGVDSIILPHGVDLNTLNKNPKPLSKDSTTEIVYSGVIFESEYAFKFIEAIKNRKDIEFTITSPQSPAYFKKIGIEGDNIKIVFFKNKKDIINLQRKADILYLSQSCDLGFEFRMKTAIPTKLFDYLVNLKPILVHSPKESYLYQFCQENKLGYPLASLKKNDILKAIKEIKEEKFKIDYEHISKFLNDYDRRKLAQRFCEVVYSKEYKILE